MHLISWIQLSGFLKSKLILLYKEVVGEHLRILVPKPEFPDVLGLELPEILAGTASGESSKDFRPKTTGDLRLDATASRNSEFTGFQLVEHSLRMIV